MFAKLSGILIALMLIAAPVIGSAQMMLATGAGGGDETAAPVLLDSPEAVREVVSQLSDAEVRKVLLDRLDAVAAESAAKETTAEGGLVEFGRKATVGVFESVVDAITRVPLIWENQVTSFSNFHDKLGTKGIVFMLTVMALAIMVGLTAELIFRRLTRKWQESAGAAGGDRNLRQTLIFLAKRLSADIVAVIIFWRVAEWAGPQIGWQLAPSMLGDAKVFAAIGAYIGGIWWWLIIIPRFAAAFVRFLLAPNRPEFRLMVTDQWSAEFMMRHQVGFALLFGFTVWIIQFNLLNGVAPGESRFGFWLNLALHIYFGWSVWKAREGLTMMARGGDPDISLTEARAAQIYPYFIIGLVVFMWWVMQIIAAYELWELMIGWPHIMTILLVGYSPFTDTVVRGMVRHLIPPMRGEGIVAEAAYRSAKRSYVRIGRVLAFVLVLMIIGRIWGIDFANLASAGVGAQFAGRFIEILAIIAVGYLVWELVSLWINRRLAAERTMAGFDINDDEPGGGEGGGIGGSRLSTVLPLLLGVAQGAIVMIFGLIALGNIGIDITPLLAGAGIIGLAVGFGAQKLVADIVSGIFFLIDDAFRTGEYIEVEGTVGTVEKISIRSMQMRHHKGPIHRIPYGEIPKITNYSRDWVIMKLKFTVPFETDPNKVKKLFKQIGKDMQQVPEFAADLLQPFKSQGVFDFDDVGMIIRGKFMAKPGKQFTLRKEIYNRVKAAFNEAGIEFVRREVRVAIPSLDNTDRLNDEDKAAIAAAASQAAQAMEKPPETK
ncbi:MAG: mechanosensitive ion channel [Paracoccaceae bacterium]|nr:mechanosensitive ion channel [Paracoccaceae bacterium]